MLLLLRCFCLRYSYDDELVEWILSRFDSNQGVSHTDLQSHGLNLVQKEDPHFKASSGWAMRFCRRHKPLLNPNFSSAETRLPAALEDRAAVFLAVLHHLIEEKGFSRGAIGNIY